MGSFLFTKKESTFQNIAAHVFSSFFLKEATMLYCSYIWANI